MDTDILTRGTIPEPTGLDRIGHVVLGGVPLAKGQLREAGMFRMELGGRNFPLEGTAAAWWPDGSIKWLRLCGAVDLKGGHSNPFALEAGSTPPTKGLAILRSPCGTGVSPVAGVGGQDARPTVGLPAKPVLGSTDIAGGPIAVRVCADPGRVLEVRDAAGNLLTRGPGLSARMRLKGPGGEARPDLVWSFDAGDVRVVEQSPARVVVRLGGRFVEGERLVGELVTFVEVLRDEPRLGIQPVWIYLGDPERDRVASLSVSVHTVFGGGDDARFGFGQDRGSDYWDACRWLPEGHRWPGVRLVQAGSSFYRFDKRTGPDASWVKIREGRRAQGWCHLGDGQGGVTGAMRYLWQEYPRMLAVDADAGTLTFGLVPGETEALDLRRYAPVVLGMPIYEAGEGPFPAQTHGATGIAKSSELMIRFHAAGYGREEAARVGTFWCEPARIMPDPEAFAASGVAGALAAKPSACAEAGERRLVELTDFLVGERETQGWYGLMDFGDVMESYYSERGQWAFDDGGYAWLNTEGLPDLGLWLMALRHGRPDWLEAAIAMTRHNRDVDMYHRGHLKGVGTRHNVNHWGCKDKEWRISMPLVKRLHDYATGDPWTREVILATVAVFQSYDRTAATAPSMTAALAGLAVKAEMTGASEDHAAVKRAMAVFAAAVGEDGHVAKSLHINLATGEGEPVADGQTLMGKYFFLLGFGGQHVLTELAETYGDEALTRALVRHAEVYLRSYDMTAWKPHEVPLPAAGMGFLALAWRRTEDSRFRGAIARALTSGWTGPELGEPGGAESLGTPQRRFLLGQVRRNKVTCVIGEFLHLWPYGYAVLAEAGSPSGAFLAGREEMRGLFRLLC